MSYTKRIVCLANSRKHRGRCVAGRELVEGKPGPWIRPISNRNKGELADKEMLLADNTNLRLLDVVEIDFLSHRPHSCQVENHLIDTRRTWRKVGTFPTAQIGQLVDGSDSLWGARENQPTDRVPEEEADTFRSSLTFVELHSARVEVACWRGRTKASLIFQYRDESYKLVLTDPTVEAQFSSRSKGEYGLEGPLFGCISLAEPFRGSRYKLVASLIRLGPNA